MGHLDEVSPVLMGGVDWGFCGRQPRDLALSLIHMANMMEIIKVLMKILPQQKSI